LNNSDKFIFNFFTNFLYFFNNFLSLNFIIKLPHFDFYKDLFNSFRLDRPSEFFHDKIAHTLPGEEDSIESLRKDWNQYMMSIYQDLPDTFSH